MASPSNRYVDPSIAADSGSGTIGDPWGDLQYGLNQVTRDATNGDQFNIKAGTAEILAGAISLTTYGTPTVDAPLIFRGYTSAADDGGIGEISGNNGNFTAFGATQFVHLKDLKVGNTGTASIVNWAGVDFNMAESVEFHTCTNATAVVGGRGRFYRCWWSGGFGAAVMGLNVQGGECSHSTFEGVFSQAISLANADTSHASFNIIKTSGASNGIRVNNVRGCYVEHNTIYSSSGTGSAIILEGSGADGQIVLNNYIEGFSGSGGKGVNIASSGSITAYGGNKFYNNATNESGVSGNVRFDLGGNGTVASSALTDPSNGDFTVGTDLKGTAYPSSFRGISTDQFFDTGAAQREEPAGGGSGSRAVILGG